MRLIELIPAVRRQRERIQQLEQENRNLKTDLRHKLRSYEEIEELHIMLNLMIRGRMDGVRVDPESMTGLCSMHDLLTWVLNQPHTNQIDRIVANLREWMDVCGIKLARLDQIDLASKIVNILGYDARGGKDVPDGNTH